MNEKISRPFDWRLPLYGALAAIFVLLPIIFFGNDVGPFLLTLLLATIAGIALLIVAVLKIMRRHTLSSVAMLVVFCAVCWALFRVSDEVHTFCRWTIHKNVYKAVVLGQPDSTAGLKHLEWESWGFVVSGNTVVYLVFDPNDSLASAARIGAPGKFSGLPCEVPRVRRLEHQWYTVMFYTNTDWDHCN